MWSYTPYLWLFIFSAAVIFALSVYAWRVRETSAGRGRCGGCAADHVPRPAHLSSAGRFAAGSLGDVSITANLGLASTEYSPKGCGKLADLVKLADEAMYRAKEGGKNKVVG